MNLPSSLLLAGPETILAISTLALLVWGAFAHRAGQAFISAAVISLLAAAAAAAFGPHGHAFNGGLIADSGSAFSKVVIYLASAACVPIGQTWFARRSIERFEYPILVILAALGMGMMVSAGDLISLYVSLELQSLSLYVLAALRRDDERSSEAGLKYFVLGALSSGLLLYGASLIYGFAGSTHFDAISRAAGAGAGAGPGMLFGLVFLMCGLGFKVSAAPFHMWTPDVYEGAPTPVVGFFAGAPKLAAMVLLARILSEAFGGAAHQWRQILIAMALISVAVGAFAGLAQSNIKRLWAYSSIANIGYALVGLAASGPAGVQSVLLFMVLYVVDVTGFFACLSALSRDGRPMETFGDFAGLMRERPALCLAMTAFCLSAIGLPPFSGFWAKVFVFQAAIGAGLAPAAVIALVGSVVAAFYYLRLIRVMWLEPAPGETDDPVRGAAVLSYVSALFAFPAVMVALVALYPWALVAATALVLR